MMSLQAGSVIRAATRSQRAAAVTLCLLLCAQLALPALAARPVSQKVDSSNAQTNVETSQSHTIEAGSAAKKLKEFTSPLGLFIQERASKQLPGPGQHFSFGALKCGTAKTPGVSCICLACCLSVPARFISTW